MDGNLTADGVWTYTYDAENRLISMATLLGSGFPNSNTTIYFSYDYLNRRIEKQIKVGSSYTLDRRYIYDGNNVVAEVDALAADSGTTQGLLMRSYAWGLDVTGSLTASQGVGALLQITNYLYSGSSLTGTTNYLPTYDGNGNIACLLNASSGAIAVAYEYGTFGELLRDQIIDSNIGDNPFRFSTKYTDIQTGLIYFGQRYYNPTWGRFINRDPVGENGGINLYGFCRNDPVNGFDVLGFGPPFGPGAGMAVASYFDANPTFPYSGGLVAGYNLDMGIATAGGGVQGSLGFMGFSGNGGSIPPTNGAFATGGAFAYQPGTSITFPNTGSDPFALGIYGGYGVGYVVKAMLSRVRI